MHIIILRKLEVGTPKKIEISKPLNILGEGLSCSDGIDKPISMCCHENPTSRLLITTELNNVLRVYELLEN